MKKPVLYLMVLFNFFIYCTSEKLNMFFKDINNLSNKNNNFRHVLATAGHSQLVLMSLLPNENIGKEVHDVDQIIVITQGTGKALMNNKTKRISEGDLLLIPEGVTHNITNIGKNKLKLFTIYAPKEFETNVIEKVKQDSAKH